VLVFSVPSFSRIFCAPSHKFFRVKFSKFPGQPLRPRTSAPKPLRKFCNPRNGLTRDIAEVEENCARVRNETGRRVLGRKAILRQSPSGSPDSTSKRNTLSPRVKCSSKWPRIDALLRNREFIAEHRAARLAWIAGLPFHFPAGTYALRHLVNPDARVIKPDRKLAFAALDLATV
jgi:hypothetical protein